MVAMIEVVEPGFYWPDTTCAMFKYLTRHVERCGRICYKSEDKITKSSAKKFVRNICRNRHESVLEHASLTAIMIGSRAFSHQLVRHRIAAYSQESMRYVNYGKVDALKVICPKRIGLKPGVYGRYTGVKSARQCGWLANQEACYAEYLRELDDGVPPEDARYSLPISCKTEVAVTYNLRQWRHFLKIRTDSHAQWEIRDIATAICKQLKHDMPEVFADILEDTDAES
jgi:thymidylate synthase (FAD)